MFLRYSKFAFSFMLHINSVFQFFTHFAFPPLKSDFTLVTSVVKQACLEKSAKMQNERKETLGKWKKGKFKSERKETRGKWRKKTLFPDVFMSRVNSQNSANAPPCCICLSSFNFCHCTIFYILKGCPYFFAYSLNMWKI